jgi:hypothetical protein
MRSTLCGKLPIGFCPALMRRAIVAFRMHKLTPSAVSWLAATVVLSGCGSNEPPGKAARVAASQRPPSATQTLSRTMVGALAASKPAAVPVQVRFALRARPAVSEPLDIGLVLLPTSAAIERISGKVVTDDGVQLVEGAQIAATERPAEGVPIEHSVKVLPQRDGIYTFKAVITVDSGGQTSTESFSMPLIVGAGMGDTAPAPAAGSHSGAAASATQ